MAALRTEPARAAATLPDALKQCHYQPSMSSIRRDPVTVFGRRGQAATGTARDFLQRNEVPLRWVDLDLDPLAAFLSDRELETATQPMALFADGSRLEAPENTRPRHDEYDLIVLGAGPAGLTPAVYAASEGQRTLIVEFHAPGGQAGTSSRIENYPGFPDGVSGAELAESAYRQAQRLGAEFLIGVLVVHARPQADGSVEVEFSSGSTIRARSGVIATGVAYRRLGIPDIEQLIGRGVRYGSPSGEALGYAGRRVAVIGGANSAGQAALHLADHAAQVTMLVRGDSLDRGMSRYLVDRIEQHDTITVRTRTEVVGADGGDRLESVAIEGPEGEQSLATDAPFVLIGAEPLTAGVEDWLRCDDRGYFMTGPDLLKSSDRSWWPSSAMAASLVHSYLAALDGETGPV